jgi:hypothetical protein
MVGAGIGLLVLAACGLLLPRPDRTGLIQVPWVLSGDDGNRLEIAAMVGGADCEEFQGVDVIESDQIVEVRAWVEVLGTTCYAVGRGYRPVTLELSSPLGGRTLTECMIEDSRPHDTRETCNERVDY